MMTKTKLEEICNKFAKNKSLLPENRLEETNKKSTSSIQSSFFNSSASFFLGMKIFFNFK